MNDMSVKTGAPVPQKVRTTVVRGGRGGGIVHSHAHPHSKNKTWVSGRASPAAEGRWERGRGGSTLRARGGRGGHAPVNGHTSYSAEPAANGTGDEDELASEAGPSRLATPTPPAMNGAGKTWEELVKAREAERAQAIREGKMDDPTKPKRLEEAITIVGTCQDMCPEFERYRRERENNLDKWECILGPDGKPTKKVDHARAVKIYERGQGDKIIPSDLRPAPVLRMTLDYLFHDLIPRGGFAETQAFVRDRSRAVRNDFTIQQDRGPIAIECHERCTRFHILSLHLMYDITTFDRALEIQQLMNSLLSLKEFYDDQRGTYQSPNELEMRIYHRLGLIRDQHERNDRPPPHIASDPAFQLITRFRSEVQAASSPITKMSKLRVNNAAMQTFAELAGVLRDRQNIVMIYLIACFLEHIFGKDTIDDMESIKGTLSTQDIIDDNPEAGAYIEQLEDGGEEADVDEEMAQEEEEDELSAFIEEDNGAAEVDENGLLDAPQQEPAPMPATSYTGISQWPTNMFGTTSAPSHESTISQSKSAPGLSSTNPFGATTTQTSLGPVPANESVFGKLASSSSTPSVFGKSGSPSVFGTTFNAFSGSPNVFGGPVFGVTPGSKPPTPSNNVDPPKQPTPSFPTQPSNSIQPSASTLLEETKQLRSLADAPPLPLQGEEDRVDPSEAVRTPDPPPPFATSKSAPVLNPLAPTFEPGPLRASYSSTPFPSSSRASLTPIKTDSLFNRIVDPIRGVFATPVDSPSEPFPSPQQPQQAGSRSSLSINTGSALHPTNEGRNGYVLNSPAAPPPLGRRAPISLPGTPTASFSNASIPPVEPTTPSTPYHFPALRINISSTTTSTPSAIPSSNSQNSQQTSPAPAFPPSTSQINGNFSTPERVAQKFPTSSRSKKMRKEQANTFRRTHGVVPVIYRRWKQKLVDNAKWKEACRSGEAYQQKIHESKTDSSLGSMPSSSSFKRQRSASGRVNEQPKRPRRSQGRISNPLEHRTDEDLAEKLNQNREKYKKRWEKGLFVKAIQEYVQSQIDQVPSNWAIWLCTNSANDKTAIWLEQKFDVPQSGSWQSEAVFSIPIGNDPVPETFPGLIVFECTPLEEVPDEIEKKYRVLDDCSRLRDILNSLPEGRHYTPTLLFINWDASRGSIVHDDISELVANYVDNEIVRNSVTITMSSDDTDEAFAKCLPSLNADLHGDLVERLHLSNLFERLSPPWREAVTIWVDACFSDEIFNWLMFSHVVDSFVDSLNALLKAVLSAWNDGASPATPLPLPRFGKEREDDSVPKVIYEWLRTSPLEADYLAEHYLSTGFNQDEDARTFFHDLLHLSFLYVQRLADNASQKLAVPKAEIQRVSSEFADALQQAQDRLRAIVKTLPRLSPKWKANGVPVNGSARNGSVSQASSPSPPTLSTSIKRARVSESFESLPDDIDADQLSVAPTSPTPSVATSAGNSSVSGVTPAMLRALSRDVLKKYGGVKRASFS